MRFNVCDHSSSSSSEEEVVPILSDNAELPETSSDELSTIEESHLENGNDTSCNSSTSEYMSSYLNEELPSDSSLSEDEKRENHQKKVGSSAEYGATINIHHEQIRVGRGSDTIAPNDSHRDEIVSSMLL